MKQRVVVFSGYNQRAVVAILRTMENLDVPYCIVASGENDSIYKTRYGKNVIAQRRNLELDIKQFQFLFDILLETYPQEKFLIAPTTEALNRLFLQNRIFLQKYRAELPLVEYDLYEEISDKITFNEMCQRYGILVPRKLNKEEMATERFVAKPKHLQSLTTGCYLSPILVTGETQRKSFCTEHNIEDYYIEEYVDGESFYLLFYFYKNGEVLSFSQQNLLQQSDGKSIVCAKASEVHKEDCVLKFKKLFSDCMFRGLVMVELRKRGNEYYMIEANPRMWGPLQLSVDAGVNFLHAMLWDWEMTDIPCSIEERNDHAKYCWLNGIKKDLEAGKQLKVLSETPMGLEEITEFLSWDVYCREDTMGIYRSE